MFFKKFVFETIPIHHLRLPNLAKHQKRWEENILGHTREQQFTEKGEVGKASYDIVKTCMVYAEVNFLLGNKVLMVNYCDLSPLS